jgi:hypothetical protein
MKNCQPGFANSDQGFSLSAFALFGFSKVSQSHSLLRSPNMSSLTSLDGGLGLLSVGLFN